MYKKNTLSFQFYGRLLAILTLRDVIPGESLSHISVNKIKTVIDEDLSTSRKNQIETLALDLVTKYLAKTDFYAERISEMSFNRKYSEFTITDRILLSIGIIELSSKTNPMFVIKDILRISDLLNNTHAVPYISGILKNHIFGLEKSRKFPNKSKILIKSR